MITQIGSLPYTNIDEAIKYSLKYPIPFLPELPKNGDSMMDYIKKPGKLSCLNKFKTHKFATVKIQCIGPASLISSGYVENEAMDKITEHIFAITDELQADQIILFLDEPNLGNIGFEFKHLWKDIFGTFDVISGVHICGHMDWDKLFDSSIKIISFDASLTDITLYPKYRNKKNIAWGIQNLENVKDFQEGDLITSPCGMSPAFYSKEDSEKEFKKLNQIYKNLRE